MTSARQVLAALGSMRLAVPLLVVLVCVLAGGTLYEARHGTAAALERVYHAGWFLGLVALLGLNVLAAMAARWPFTRRHTGFVVTHTAILIVIAGAAVSYRWGQRGSVRLVPGQSADRFVSAQRLFLAGGDASPRWRDGSVVAAPPGETAVRLALHHRGFEVVRWVAPDRPARFGKVPVRLRRVRDLDAALKQAATTSAPATHPATQPTGPALLGELILIVDEAGGLGYDAAMTDGRRRAGRTSIGRAILPQQLGIRLFVDCVIDQRCRDLPFTLRLESCGTDTYPGTDRPSMYRSVVVLSDPRRGRVVRKTIEMNDPLQYAGYTFCQSQMLDEGGLTASVLSVTRDPGWPVALAGYVLVVLGMTLVIGTRMWEHARRASDRIAETPPEDPST